MQAPGYYEYIQQYLWIFYAAGLIFPAALVLFETKKYRKGSMLLLFLGGFALYSFMALSDPFLHDWDEQYHALVAKNMGAHFFLPTLIEAPVFADTNTSFSHDLWTKSHIWLHKQPFFLWQMALSMKIFGTNIYAMRLPSVLMAALLPLLLVRMGKILRDERTGFYAGLLFLSAHFMLRLVSGRLNTDHNDVAFIFYVTASFWAWFEYQHSGKKRWLLLIGLFSGIAILTKWMTGLIVYAGWGLSVLADKNKRTDWLAHKQMLISLLITAAVVLPWQMYILWRWPDLARFEYAHSSRHFLHTMEGHGGDMFYHWNIWDFMLAPYFNYIALIALTAFAFLKIKRNYKIALISWIVLIFTFFSLAATKMPAFTMTIVPVLYLVLATVLTAILSLLRFSKFAYRLLPPIIISVIFIWLFSFNEIFNRPKSHTEQWKKTYARTLVYRELGVNDQDDKSVYINFPYHDDIVFLFETGKPALKDIPENDRIENLKQSYRIYVFDDGSLPDYIEGDSLIVKIKTPIFN